MKVGRIIGIVLLALLVVYLLLFNAANPVDVELPLSPIIPTLPVIYVVVFALVLGFLIGWLPARLLAWRRGRELRRLEQRLAELAPGEVVPPPQAGYAAPDYPVIPDRAAQPEQFTAASGTYDGSYDANEDEAG